MTDSPTAHFWRRLAVAACAALSIAAPPPAAAGDGSAQNDERPGLLGQLGAIAAQAYETIDETAIAPSLHAAEEAIDAPAAQQVLGQIGDTARALVSTAGATLRPLAEGAVALLTGPLATQAYRTAGSAAQEVATGLRHRVADPLLAAVHPRRDANLVPVAAAPSGALLAAAPEFNFGPLDDALRTAVEADDPLESFNRVMFDLNDRLRLRLFHPVTDFYLRVTSPPVQAGVRHFFFNLREPVTMASSLLQANFDDAGNATMRFGLNTTLGIVGIFDPAASMGYPPRMHDLEETLCTYGIPSGPYLVLPIFGPGTIRDATGRLATLVAYYEAMGATLYIPYRITDIAVQSIDVQDKLTKLNSMSVDPYVVQRSIYLTTRNTNCGRQATVEREFFTK
jgi:phospholipid-binding lipoprotein MlaA